jgi:predicted anti-sigma-YlaC factor YlaD
LIGLLKKLFHRDGDDCEEVRKLSSDYLDEDLAPPKQSAIRAHLINCGPCRDFVDTLATTIGILSRFPKVSTPPTFHDSVMERINQEKK